MDNKFLRTHMLIGSEAAEKLKNSKVAVFGIGGVGGYAAEALVRTGIGRLDIIDKDIVDITNINRQIIADMSTVGKEKTAVMYERLKCINPEAEITPIRIFYMPDTADEFDLTEYDYIIDAVDNVTAKLELIKRACENNIPILSSMGTGNKLHPEMLEITDIYNTSICPLARVMRRELKKRDIRKLKVIYSKEEPIKSVICENGRHAPASAMFVPACAGIMLAGETVRDLCGIN